MIDLKMSDVFKVFSGVCFRADTSTVNENYNDGCTPYDAIDLAVSSFDDNQALIKKQQEQIELLSAPQNEWISVDTPEDMPIGEEVLCWDGCQYHLDYADMDADTGAHYMANGTDVESYKLLTPPKEI